MIRKRYMIPIQIFLPMVMYWSNGSGLLTITNNGIEFDAEVATGWAIAYAPFGHFITTTAGYPPSVALIAAGFWLARPARYRWSVWVMRVGRYLSIAILVFCMWKPYGMPYQGVPYRDGPLFQDAFLHFLLTILIFPVFPLVVKQIQKRRRERRSQKDALLATSAGSADPA